MTDLIKRTVSLTKRASDGPAADLSNAPPDLVKRVEKATFALSQVGLADIDAEVVVLLDYSGSMAPDYASGLVQTLLERALAFGLQVDADGTIPVVPFASQAYEPVPVSVANYQGVVRREIEARYRMGSTDLAGAFLVARDLARDAQKPIFLIVITDGEPNDYDYRAKDAPRTTSVVCELSGYPVFIKFLAIRDVEYLQKLDDLPSGPQSRGLFGRRTGPERLLDNVDSKFIPNPGAVSDLDFFRAMADEWATWIKEATDAGVLS